MKKYNLIYQNINISIITTLKKIRCDIYEVANGAEKLIGQILRDNHEDIDGLIEEVKNNFPYKEKDIIVSISDTRKKHIGLPFFTTSVGYWNIMFFKTILKKRET